MATCHDCKVDYPFNLDRHHIIPRGLPGAEEPSNLIDICPNCHRTRHTGEAADSIPWVRAHTPEANAKRTETMRKRWADPAYRERVLASRARSRTPESDAKRAASVRAWYANDENRERVAEIVRANNQSPEHREHLRELHRQGRLKPPPPGTAEGMAHAREFLPPPSHRPRKPETSEANAKRSEAMKRRWAEGAFADRKFDPDVMSEAQRRAWAEGRHGNHEINHEARSAAARRREAAKRTAGQ